MFTSTAALVTAVYAYVSALEAGDRRRLTCGLTQSCKSPCLTQQPVPCSCKWVAFAASPPCEAFVNEAQPVAGQCETDGTVTPNSPIFMLSLIHI